MLRISVLLFIPAFALNLAAQTTERGVFHGRLTVGKTESIIVYLSAETDDLFAYCFPNRSRAGRAILSKCRNGQECEFAGRVDRSRKCAAGENFQSEGKIISVTKARRIRRGK